MRFFGAVLAGSLAVFIAVSAQAKDQERGAVTNLPIPRFVSLKTGEGNVRRGPSLTHRIDWVFKARGMPLEVTGEFGHWRRVQDRDGVGGWVHYSLLSGVRTAIVETDLTPLYSRADPESAVNAYLEAGVIARIDQCAVEWCRIRAEGHKGWTPKPTLWGVRAGEVID
ncbi:SH3 domain-containing protein [Aliiroseovarius subalbicans]|uniref:SH3 domain-containing protein n=1 Tax=Aliiroseovarius subalbicans TaxID=2925840 RepID=UPI001F57ED95|nr:SH3 domain-containing protein [Aliiroseovarius subalbicans]MCI2399376.1 SH3 domain-containing protein [Aliiroseovarius subalbicans]